MSRLAVLLFAISCSGPTRPAVPPAHHAVVPAAHDSVVPAAHDAVSPVCGPDVQYAAACSTPDATCRDSAYDEDGVIYCGVQITGYYCDEGTWHAMRAHCDSAGPKRKRVTPPFR